MSEKTIQESIQATLRTLDGFRDASITINDWSNVDLSENYGPIVIIRNSVFFTSRQDSASPVTTWTIPVELWVRNQVSMTEALNAFRDFRQIIIDQFNAGAGQRGPGEAVTADLIQTQEHISPIYDSYVTLEDSSQAVPIYWMQPLLFTVQEY